MSIITSKTSEAHPRKHLSDFLNRTNCVKYTYMFRKQDKMAFRYMVNSNRNMYFMSPKLYFIRCKRLAFFRKGGMIFTVFSGPFLCTIVKKKKQKKQANSENLCPPLLNVCLLIYVLSSETSIIK